MSLAQGNNTPTRPRIEPGSPDPESDALTTRPVRPLAYQWLDNVKMYKYAKFDQNIPCSSRVMNIFTLRPLPAEMMLGEASLPFYIPMAGQC